MKETIARVVTDLAEARQERSDIKMTMAEILDDFEAFRDFMREWKGTPTVPGMGYEIRAALDSKKKAYTFYVGVGKALVVAGVTGAFLWLMDKMGIGIGDWIAKQ